MLGPYKDSVFIGNFGRLKPHMIGAQLREIDSLRTPDDRRNSGSLRWYIATLVFLLIGMTTTTLVARFSIVWVLALLILPLLAIASLSGLRYAAASYGLLRQRLTVWHGLLLLLFLSGLVFRVRAVDQIQESAIDAWALYRLGLMGVVALVLASRLATRKTDGIKSLFRGLIGAMAIYAIICAISTIWSVFPEWTLYKSLEYLTDIAVIAAIVASVRTIDEYSSLFDWIWVLYGVLLCSVWIGAALAPSLAFVSNRGVFGFELEGVIPQVSSNGVGEASALLGAVAFTRLILRRHRKGSASWYVLLLTLSVVTLLISQARSGWLGFSVGVLLAAFHRNARLAIAGLIVFALAAFVFTATTQVAHTYLLRGQDPELFHSLSGRLDWWQRAWSAIQERPWFGYGAYAGGRFVVLTHFGDMSTSSVHNSYVETTLGCGITGLIPFLGALVGAWWQLARARFKLLISKLDGQLAVEALSVLGVLTARSMFSVTMIWHPAVEFLVVLGYAELLRRGRSEVISATPGGLHLRQGLNVA